MKRKGILPFCLGITLLCTIVGCGSNTNLSTTNTVTEDSTQTIETGEPGVTVKNLKNKIESETTLEMETISRYVESENHMDESDRDPFYDQFEIISDNILTQEEIDYFNEWIAQDVNCLFALSQYTDISYLNFSMIASEFDGGVEELNLTKQQIDEEFLKYNNGKCSDTDVTMFTTKAMNEYLMENANITMDDLRFAFEPDSKTYDLYFSEHGDTSMVHLACIGGYSFGTDGYTVCYTSMDGMVQCKMNFEKIGDRYVVCSNHLDSCPDQYYFNLDPDDFYLPHSDCSYVSEDELSGFTKESCRIARNEIYARHGLIFKNQELADYFSQFDWYEPRYTSEEFGYNNLNPLEQQNVSTIETYEKKMGYR